MAVEFAHRLFEVTHNSVTFANPRRAQVLEIPTFNTSAAGGRLGPAARALRFMDYAASVEYEKPSGVQAVGAMAASSFVMKFKSSEPTPTNVIVTCANMVAAQGAWDGNGDILAMRRDFVAAGTDYTGTSFVSESA